MSILIKGMDKPTDCGLCPFEDFGYCNVKGERNTSERGIDADCPLIEIADRPQGEWIEFDTKWGRSLYYCTNCMETSEVPTAFGKPLYDYCPNCGAKMKGADDEKSV